jgi:hypothetical protein
VAAGALAWQAESLLTASDANLPNVAAARLADNTVANYIIDNASQLVAPPGATTATLAATLAGAVASGTTPMPANYLALGSDSLSLVNGTAVTTYTLAQFQSAAGIQVAWPLPSPMMLRVVVAEAGSVSLPAGAKLSAAVAISETTATGQGKMLGYIDQVNVRQTAQGLVIEVPTSGAEAVVYGISTDGLKKAVVDFRNSVAGITNTLRTSLGGASATNNNIVLGEVVNYAINQVSNDFTGIYSLRGKYKVEVVVNGLPLRQANGQALPTVTISVPTGLNSSGAVVSSKTVTGPGLVGHISLVD